LAKTSSSRLLSSSYLYLGRIYWRLGKRASSLDWFLRSANRNPSSEAFYYAGSYYLNHDEEERALLYFRRAVETGKKGEKYHDRAAFFLFRYYLVRGMKSLALRYLEEYEDGRPEKDFWLWKLGKKGCSAARASLERYPNSFYYTCGLGGEVRRYVKGYYPEEGGKRLEEEVVRELDFLRDEGFYETGLKLLEVMRGGGYFEGEVEAFYHYFKGLFYFLLENYPAAIKSGFEVLNSPNYMRVLSAEERREVWRFSYPTPYLETFKKYGVKYGVRTRFLLSLAHQESRFQRDALSPAGAIGLMQLLPSTARQLSRVLGRTYWRMRLTEVDYNVHLGTYYIHTLMRRYHNDLLPALISYNAGPEVCKRWMEEYGERLRGFERVESVYPTETRLYVKRVLHNIRVYTVVLSGV